ncbi:MAG: 4-hydroxy-tetrahydrodipicolinate reductase [Janthinobacterium lividum]
MRIGIAGIAGRMGRLLAAEVVRSGATLSGGTLRPGSDALPPEGVAVLADFGALARASDVVVDFTNAGTVQGHAVAVAAAGVGWVLGTSGLSAADEAAVVEASGRAAVVHAPNFAPGVVLVLAMAERLAAALPAAEYDAEILEMHHRQKVDAPSGTALGLGRAVAAGRGVALADVMRTAREGQAGARREGEIGFAALRGGQVVGEHTVLFAGASEHIALTHRAFDRGVFAGGAVRAAHWLGGRGAGLYGMGDVLGLR